MPDQSTPDTNPDTRPNPPQNAPEMPDAEPTRHQRPLERTRAMSPVNRPNIPVPPQGRAPVAPPMPMAYTGEKPKRGQRPPRRSKADSGFYLPLWSIGLMLFGVVAIVGCFVLFALNLGGRQVLPTSAPRFVIITAEPTLPGQESLPSLLVSPTFPAGFGPGFQGTMPAFSLTGPTLEPVVFTSTPTEAPAIQVGSVVQIITAGGANIRNAPGTGSAAITVGREGQQFTVIGGPEQANDLTWWQVRNADGSVTGWVAENDRTNDLIAVVSP